MILNKKIDLQSLVNYKGCDYVLATTYATDESLYSTLYAHRIINSKLDKKCYQQITLSCVTKGYGNRKLKTLNEHFPTLNLEQEGHRLFYINGYCDYDEKVIEIEEIISKLLFKRFNIKSSVVADIKNPLGIKNLLIAQPDLQKLSFYGLLDETH